MKILVLVDELHHAGGLERSLSHKAATWLSFGYQVEVLTLSEAGSDFYVLPADVSRRALSVRYQRDQRLHSVRNIREAVKHFWLLREFLKMSRPDVVIHSGYGFDFYFLPILLSRGTLGIKENHSSRFASGAIGIACRLKALVRRRFDAAYGRVVFLSPEEARIAGLSNSLVIPNSIPPLVVRAPRPVRMNYVIAAGRICHVKGFDRLVEAWALSVPSLPGWSLHIYGSGEPSDVAALKNLVLETGVEGSAHIHASTPEIHERIAESRIYAMTSRSECFPMVLLEAMQLGVPVVAFDCPTGPRNIVEDGRTGFLVADGDVREFSERLVKLALDDELQTRLGLAARKNSEQYEVAQVAPLWERLFKGES